MKIIDLLNNIANNEEVPKKIKYLERVWELTTNEKYKTLDYKSSSYSRGYLFDNNSYIQNLLIKSLYDEIEIIEEKPKKLDITRIRQNEYCTPLTVELSAKINELIDYLSKKESDK